MLEVNVHCRGHSKCEVSLYMSEVTVHVRGPCICQKSLYINGMNGVVGHLC